MDCSLIFLDVFLLFCCFLVHGIQYNQDHNFPFVLYLFCFCLPFSSFLKMTLLVFSVMSHREVYNIYIYIQSNLPVLKFSVGNMLSKILLVSSGHEFPTVFKSVSLKINLVLSALNCVTSFMLQFFLQYFRIIHQLLVSLECNDYYMCSFCIHSFMSVPGVNI